MFQIHFVRISLVLTAFVVSPTHAQTWQTVRPSMPTADPSRYMDAAQNSMNSAFSGLSNALKAAEETSQANWNTIKNNNTQDYLDALHSKKTVKDLLDSQYALEQQRTGYGAQIDREVARGAFDNRLSSLIKYENSRSSSNNSNSESSSGSVMGQATSSSGSLVEQPTSSSSSVMGQTTYLTSPNGKRVKCTRYGENVFCP
jgi:hypothetical protein